VKGRAKPKRLKPLLANSYTRDTDGGDWTWDGGLGRRARREATTRQAERAAVVWEACNRCRGTRGGPNAFVPERKCKACQGLGSVAVS
jgi:hypothetical protein